MTPLAVLLHQRGTLALHAAAVSRDGVAVLLAGDSATGKSTVAAELLARGWRFLADELAVVEPSESGSMQVRPIWPEVVLWRDSMKRMSMTGLPVHGNEMGWPRAASVAEKFGTSARMGMICCLEVGAAAGSVEIGELQGLSKYLWPRKHAYGHRLAGVYLHHSEHLSRVLELSSRVPAFRIVRPSANWTVQTVADHVERSFWQAGNG